MSNLFASLSRCQWKCKYPSCSNPRHCTTVKTSVPYYQRHTAENTTMVGKQLKNSTFTSRIQTKKKFWLLQLFPFFFGIYEKHVWGNHPVIQCFRVAFFNESICPENQVPLVAAQRINDVAAIASKDQRTRDGFIFLTNRFGSRFRSFFCLKSNV